MEIKLSPGTTNIVVFVTETVPWRATNRNSDKLLTNRKYSGIISHIHGLIFHKGSKVRQISKLNCERALYLCSHSSYVTVWWFLWVQLSNLFSGCTHSESCKKFQLDSKPGWILVHCTSFRFHRWYRNPKVQSQLPNKYPSTGCSKDSYSVCIRIESKLLSCLLEFSTNLFYFEQLRIYLWPRNGAYPMMITHTLKASWFNGMIDFMVVFSDEITDRPCVSFMFHCILPRNVDVLLNNRKNFV